MKKMLLAVMLLVGAAFPNVLYVGSQTSIGELSGKRYTLYSATFKGGEQGDVSVSGDGSSDLDVYVYDENGNEVCRSTKYGDDEHCSFNPKWTGEFTIKVVNLGYSDNTFIVKAY